MGFNLFLGYFFQRNFKLIKAKSPITVFIWLTTHLGVYWLLSELGIKSGRNDINPLLLITFALFIINIAFLPKISSNVFNPIKHFLKKYDITFGVFIYYVVVINFISEYEICSQNLAPRLLLLIGFIYRHFLYVGTRTANQRKQRNNYVE
tara:strand:- start:12277 stop:12726 length:450 start_codon:yes stop_codon:yes gene_type:complete